MSKPIVINLFGAAGSGKSSGAAYIFARLKEKGVNCELVSEFAKDLTWENNSTALNCQEYVTGVQSYRQARCRDKVDVIVTDSPLPLGIFYNKNPLLDESFTKMVLNIFFSYINYNYYITRVREYEPIGRNQTKEESDIIGDKILNFLDEYGIVYTHGIGDTKFFDYIVNKTLEDLRKSQAQ